MVLKNFIAYIKYKFGLSLTVPAAVINSIPIKENKEPLVDIKHIKPAVFFGNRLKDQNAVFLRQSVAEKIAKVAASLPDDKHLIIYDAFRSLEHQKKLWDKKYKYFQDLYPSETPEQITKRTRAVIADPRRGFGGHQTGGATDVGLCDENGVELNMGTTYSTASANIKTNSHVDPEATNNRKLLCNAMKKQGFVNYPNEWWHFCYGDRMWAAYSNKKHCMYGLVDEKLMNQGK